MKLLAMRLGSDEACAHIGSCSCWILGPKVTWSLSSWSPKSAGGSDINHVIP